MTVKLDEEWQLVAGFPGYEVSNLGRVRSWLPRNRRANPPIQPRILKLNPNTFGYLACSLSQSGQRATGIVHKLVLEAFVGPRPEGKQACHCNGDRRDNRLANLRWDTAKANAADREAHGRTARGARHTTQLHPELILCGELHPNAKLTTADVRWILRANDDGTSQTAIANAIGLQLGTINGIVRGRSWQHISGPWLQEKAR